MIKEYLNRIEKCSPEAIHSPLTDFEVHTLQKRIKKLFDLELNQGYLDFLKLTNGLDFDGEQIYGFADKPIDELLHGDEYILDVILFNTLRYEKDFNKDYFFLGDGNLLQPVQYLPTGKFQLIDRVCQDTIEEFGTFREMLDFLLKDLAKRADEFIEDAKKEYGEEEAKRLFGYE